jgi:hypothetical protein
MDLRCSCGKICYSFREARCVINDAARSRHVGHRRKIPKREYKCELCGWYHVASDNHK